MNLNRKVFDGLLLHFLGCSILVILSVLEISVTSDPLIDFHAFYFPENVLYAHQDLYNPALARELMKADGGADVTSEKDPGLRQVATQFPYPPSALAVSVPFTAMPRPLAQKLWVIFSITMLSLAGVLILAQCTPEAYAFAGLLTGALIAGSAFLIWSGNVAAIVIGFLVVSAWCFTKRKYEWLGVVCLALALASKPQDAGFIWLLFLVTKRYRVRAIQALAVLILICIPLVLWVWSVSPHWWSELHANAASYFVPGGQNDPVPASNSKMGYAMIVCLQAIFSFFTERPILYNLGSYAVSVPLLAIFFWNAIRKKSADLWLGLATISVLTMLPVYHRATDVKLLIFTVPACVVLWKSNQRLQKLTVAVTVAAILLNGDFGIGVAKFLALELKAHTQLHLNSLVAVAILPATLSLFASGLMLLWVYVRQGKSINSTLSHGPEERFAECS